MSRNKNHRGANLPHMGPLNHQETMMKLDLSALKVHLAHCCADPGIGRHIGLAFTTTGIPAVAAVPHA